MLGPRSLFFPKLLQVRLNGVRHHRYRDHLASECPTLTRSAIASAVVSCIVICRVVRAAPTTVTQGLGSGAASSMMPATIVVRIMIGRIIYAASIDRA